MQLPDWMIEQAVKAGHIGISPFERQYLQPASIDLTLGGEFRLENGLPVNEKVMKLSPGQFILGHTREHIKLGPDFCGRIDGKSTLARQGLAVHITAGFVDPGFDGQLTLEIKNLCTHTVLVLTPGMRVAQLSIQMLAGQPAAMYGDVGLGSAYQGSTGAGLAPASRSIRMNYPSGREVIVIPRGQAGTRSDG